ncbi:MAG TPA: helix-turn-helix domain-containing protein [Candidatus Limnocylindrales bacterium]|nr:helix-turn-helix domain-containing protein [Candidatus Limnocylindrales bacterium]
MERRPATIEEARALANPLRLRILRLCLDRALTNKELAVRLERDPGTILHHVRMLADTGFLRAEASRPGPRGSVERPYRATGKSWTLTVGEEEDTTGTLASVDAFRDELSELRVEDIRGFARLAVRLSPEAVEHFTTRLGALIEELAGSDDPDGEPYGFLFAGHRRRDEAPAALVRRKGRARRADANGEGR